MGSRCCKLFASGIHGTDEKLLAPGFQAWTNIRGTGIQIWSITFSNTLKGLQVQCYFSICTWKPEIISYYHNEEESTWQLECHTEHLSLLTFRPLL